MALKSQAPERPASGEWPHADGQTYVLRRVAYSMGFNAGFISRYLRRPHPAIGRKLSEIEVRFRITTKDGGDFTRPYPLLLKEELLKIEDERKKAKSLSPQDPWPTMSEGAARMGCSLNLLYRRIDNGTLQVKEGLKAERIGRRESRTPAGARRRIDLGVRVYGVKRVNPQQLERRPSAGDGRITLRDAARKAKIVPLGLWNHWFDEWLGSKEWTLALIGRRPAFENGRALTYDGDSRGDLRSVSVADYEAIVAAYEEAASGRIYRKGETYLSPPTIAKEYEDAPAFLTNLRVLRPKQLGRPFRPIKAHYLTPAGKLTYGSCYAERDLDLVYKRKKPAPQTIQANRPDETSTPRRQPAAGATGFTGEAVRVTGRPGSTVVAIGPKYQIQVNGCAVPLSQGEWELMQFMANARDKGETIRKPDLEKFDENWKNVVKRVVRKAEAACPGVPIVRRPKVKSSKDGYQLL